MSSETNGLNNTSSNIEGEGSILVSIYNNTNRGKSDNEQSFEMNNVWMRPSMHDTSITNDITTNSRTAFADTSFNDGRNFKITNDSVIVNHQLNNPTCMRSFSVPTFQNNRPSMVQSPTQAIVETVQTPPPVRNPSNFKEWTRVYLFGREQQTGAPRIQRTS